MFNDESPRFLEEFRDVHIDPNSKLTTTGGVKLRVLVSTHTFYDNVRHILLRTFRDTFTISLRTMYTGVL